MDIICRLHLFISYLAIYYIYYVHFINHAYNFDLKMLKVGMERISLSNLFHVIGPATLIENFREFVRVNACLIAEEFLVL